MMARVGTARIHLLRPDLVPGKGATARGSERREESTIIVKLQGLAKVERGRKDPATVEIFGEVPAVIVVKPDPMGMLKGGKNRWRMSQPIASQKQGRRQRQQTTLRQSSTNRHWTRISELVGGRLSYQPPTNDINAPDLYILVMAFGTYIVLAGISLVLSGKFCPEALNWQFVKGTIGWLLQVMLLKVSLFSLGGGDTPLLDMIAYASYTFTGMCLAVSGRITSLKYHTCYLTIIWACLCMDIFLVKTLKPTMYTEFRSYSSKQYYHLIGIAFSQFPPTNLLTQQHY